MVRRSFLALAALACARPARAQAAARERGAAELSYRQFLEAAVPLAEELAGDRTRPGEDRYLHALASLAVRLGDVAEPADMRENSFFAGGGPRKFIGANDSLDPNGDPFVVLHWRLEPGARIGLHAHTYGNVVTLGLAGEARVENFELLDAGAGEPEFEVDAEVQVRKVQDQILRRGSINLVPLAHGYVHGFVAGPEGARGLDITTRVRERRPAPSLEVGAAAIDAARQIYSGRWRID